MVTSVRSRRLPVRACTARIALADAAMLDQLAGWVPGQHRVEVREDRLACQVRHSVVLPGGAGVRLWWAVIGRPVYEQLVEDAFDRLALQTGAPIRRPPRWAPYGRALRRAVLPTPDVASDTTDAAARRARRGSSPSRWSAPHRHRAPLRDGVLPAAS